MKHKQRRSETQSEAESRKCYSCNKPDSETVLLTIILPPTIMERQDLCPPCLAVAIDDSRKIGEGIATQ
jgi:hypothetical protein